jgi:hypothetical protein
MLCVCAERRGGLTGSECSFLVERVRADEETEFCGRRGVCFSTVSNGPMKHQTCPLCEPSLAGKLVNVIILSSGQQIGCCGILAGRLAEVGEAQRSCKGGWGKAVPLQDRSIDQ